MENGFDGQMNGAAPKQVMQNIITVKVHTKQETLIDKHRFILTVN